MNAICLIASIHSKIRGVGRLDQDFSGDVQHVPLAALKGRGTAQDLAHRFAVEQREGVDDGWRSLQGADDADTAPAAVPTQWRWETVRSALSRNRSPDLAFELSVNPYRGCEHGCIYCYARPTHSYLDLSPGLDFETRLVAKRNIAQVLEAELAHPRYQPGRLALGTVTDCYQPLERQLRLSRAVMDVLARAHHPFALITKSSAVEADLDLLAPLAAQRQVAVYITLTTLDPVLARILEPRAAAPHRRLRTLRTLAEAGIPVGVSVAPQIPFINEDMEQVLAAAQAAGARHAFYSVLRLPWEVAPLFRGWLAQHYPQRLERVMARVQDMRGGRDYNSDFAHRMKGQGLWADLLRQRFETSCRRLGLNRQRMELDASAFRPPDWRGQQRLF